MNDVKAFYAKVERLWGRSPAYKTILEEFIKISIMSKNDTLEKITHFGKCLEETRNEILVCITPHRKTILDARFVLYEKQLEKEIKLLKMLSGRICKLRHEKRKLARGN